MTQEEINKFLLSLYREIPERSFDDYMRYAFDQLSSIFRFESGWIGHGSLSEDGGMKFEGVNLYHQPLEKLIEYKNIAHLDLLAIRTAKSPGHVHVWNVEDALPSQKKFAPMRDLSRRYDLRHTLTLAIIDSDPIKNSGEESGLYDQSVSAGISLARCSINDPFTQNDKKLAAFLIPHFAQVRAMKLKIDEAKGNGSTLNEWQIFSNMDGCLVSCPDPARILLQMEWPQWDPPVLPTVLLDSLKSSNFLKFVGKYIAVSGVFIGGALILRLSLRSSEFLLTKAQRDVVGYIINGLANKEVAKKLNLSDNTVRNHLAAVYRKLGVRNKTELSLRWKSSPASRD